MRGTEFPISRPVSQAVPWRPTSHPGPSLYTCTLTWAASPPTKPYQPGPPWAGVTSAHHCARPIRWLGRAYFCRSLRCTVGGVGLLIKSNWACTFGVPNWATCTARPVSTCHAKHMKVSGLGGTNFLINRIFDLFNKKVGNPCIDLKHLIPNLATLQKTLTLPPHGDVKNLRAPSNSKEDQSQEDKLEKEVSPSTECCTYED